MKSGEKWNDSCNKMRCEEGKEERGERKNLELELPEVMEVNVLGYVMGSCDDGGTNRCCNFHREGKNDVSMEILIKSNHISLSYPFTILVPFTSFLLILRLPKETYTKDICHQSDSFIHLSSITFSLSFKHTMVSKCDFGAIHPPSTVSH